MSKSSGDEPPFISVPAAAEILGCSDVWVIRLIEKGTLEGFRLSGRAWAVNRESVTKNVQEYLKRDPTVAGRRRSKLG
jgi:excisionase family DNA binding protein